MTTCTFEVMEVARSYGYTVCLFDSEQEYIYHQRNTQRSYFAIEGGCCRQLNISVWRTWRRYWCLAICIWPRIKRRAGTIQLRILRLKAASRPLARRKPLLNLLSGKPASVFVKGLSKSFGPESVISSLPELDVLLEKHDIAPQDSLFVREFVGLSSKPEQRFFVVRNEAFGAAEAQFPEMLKPALEALKSRWFYTVDVAYTQTGQPVIIEVGDGQVSDVKEWSVAELYSSVIFRLSELATA